MKVLISLDAALLHRVDRRARSKGLSRSAYLSQLAKEDLDKESASHGTALEQLDRLFKSAPARDVTLTVRAQRDSR